MKKASVPKRRSTYSVKVGNVTIGGNHPIVVQSMTNTTTADIDETVEQIRSLTQSGSEIVRLTINDDKAARAIPIIKSNLLKLGVKVPLVGDFHYNGHLLLSKYPECAKALDKYRINPGNVGGKRRDEHFKQIIDIAIHHNKPVRIGVNWGSLDKTILDEMIDKNAKEPIPLDTQEVMLEAMVASALNSARYAREYGLAKDAIVLSVKVSRVPDLIQVYTNLARRCQYPLHLGLTEAGMGYPGVIATTAGLAILLNQGIGDTIRVSLTPRPGADRTEEVIVARQILQSLGIRNYYPQVISCPGCGRTNSPLLQRMSQAVGEHIQKMMPQWSRVYPGVEEMKVAVMGCVVNGPGESKHADIGISLPGDAEEPKAPVYIDGNLVTSLQGEELINQFLNLINEYVNKRFGK